MPSVFVWSSWIMFARVPSSAALYAGVKCAARVTTSLYSSVMFLAMYAPVSSMKCRPLPSFALRSSAFSSAESRFTRFFGSSCSVAFAASRSRFAASSWSAVFGKERKGKFNEN